MPVLKRGILTLCGRRFDLRAGHQAFLTQGNAFWACFHQKGPLEDCRYYREVGAGITGRKPRLAGVPAALPQALIHAAHFQTGWKRRPVRRVMIPAFFSCEVLS